MTSILDYAIVTTDRQGRIRTWSARAAALFGHRAGEMIGRPISALYGDDARAAVVAEEDLRSALRSGSARERRCVRRDGTAFPASLFFVPLDDGGDSGFAILAAGARGETGTSADAEKRPAGGRVAAEQPSRRKEDVLAMLSHELRNSLAPILSQCEILLRATESEASPTARQSARAIREMVRDQAQLVDDMHDVARARLGKLTVERRPVELSSIIDDSVQSVRDELARKQISLDVRAAGRSLTVNADRTRIRQIVWNLLSNACKFTPAGGTIDVSIEREGSDVRLDVRDTGCGIEPDALPSLFDWFTQASPGKGGGLGIGLALVRQLVELHGGRVQAHSEGLGKGARFTVWLPLHETAGQPTTSYEPAPPAGPVPLDQIRILIVDDSRPNADAMRELLQLVGATVTIATTGAEALDALAKAPVDVVVCDIALPDVDGYTVLATLRAGNGPNAKTPAIAYSGFSQPDDAHQRAPAFDAYLTKPVDFDRLMATIRSLAKRAR